MKFNRFNSPRAVVGSNSQVRGNLPTKALHRFSGAPRNVTLLNMVGPTNPIPAPSPWSALKHSLTSDPIFIARVGAPLNPPNGPKSAEVISPSSRLRCSIACVLEPNNGTVYGSPGLDNTQAYWFLQGGVRNPENGRETFVQTIYGGNAIGSGTGPLDRKPLPDAYEMDSAVQLVRAYVEVFDDSIAGAGTWFDETLGTEVAVRLVVTWEPNVQMSEDELKALYAQCSIRSPTKPHIVRAWP